MLPAALDIERRRPVWSELSELFLDTEKDEAALRRFARELLDSGYTDRELTDILFGEVYPACSWNAWWLAVEWAGFELDWLQERILRNDWKFWKGWRITTK